MKLKAAIRFKLSFYFRLLSIIGLFYLVFALIGPGIISISSEEKLTVWEPEILFCIYSALAIFLTSTSGMLFLFQNGASRKTMFLSTFITMIIGNVICIVLSQVLKFVLSFVLKIHVSHEFFNLYGHYFKSQFFNELSYFILILVLAFIFSSFAMLLGTVLSLATKSMKMILFGSLSFIVIFGITIINIIDIDIFKKLGFIIGNTHSVEHFHLFPITPIIIGVMLIIILCSIHFIVNKNIETNRIITDL